MEPITTAAAISAVVTYFAKSFADNQSFKEFTSDFSTATVDWIKPLFLKEDGTVKEVVEQLKAKPDSTARKEAVEALLKIELEDHPKKATHLQEMLALINEKTVGTGNQVFNQGAKIAQQNINSKVDNSGTSFTVN